KAYEIRKKLVVDHPDLWSYRHNRAALCNQAAFCLLTMDGADGSDHARGRELARESLAIEPENAGYWTGLALAEYRAGDLDAALRAEAKALELRKGGSNRGDWQLLAVIHLGRGDHEQARWWWANTVLLQMRAPGGWKALEWDLSHVVREDEARLRALLPDDAE